MRQRSRPTVDWEQLADGRVWRLTRGRHFEGSDRAVVDAARLAAERMGKVVSVSRENFGKTACYVWLQFADAVVEFGAPCPRCGSMTLTRSHPGFASCPSCSARLVLHVAEDATGEVFGGDGPVSAADDDGEAPAAAAQGPGGEPLPAASGVSAPPRPAPPSVARQLPQVRFDPRTRSIERLEFYERIHLRSGSNPAGNSSFYGFGSARGVKPTFLYVEFFPAADDPQQGDHRVTAIAARPYAAGVDLRALGHWGKFELRPVTEAERDELTPVHPYYSLHRATGVHVIPVAEGALTDSPRPDDPTGGVGTS